jgi:hypothetical protein
VLSPLRVNNKPNPRIPCIGLIVLVWRDQSKPQQARQLLAPTRDLKDAKALL